ncbi:MAG: acetyl-CoA hydrolase/transferase family protein [Alphaproteobacteria bacterium]|nr:acetyl-CoA hydrolase/transferase family protein [Alphaproteobacteria bacterium]
MPKPVSAATAVSGIASGERVLIGSGAAEPRMLVEAMTARADQLRGVDIVHIMTLGPAPYTNPEYAESFKHTAFFVGTNTRQAVLDGRADAVPIFLGEIPALFHERLPLDWVLVQLSPPDRHGFCTVGVSADLVVSAIRNARHVVAELNPQMPRTLGQTAVHVSKLHAVVEVDHPLPELPPIDPNEVTTRIGANVASLIRDGDCLQIGIGGIPNAAVAQIADRRHLGIHTEMLTDGIVELFEAGAIDGSLKSLMPEKIVCSFAMGTKRLYEFVDDNPLLFFAGNEFTNDPFTIARNDNVVAVNSAIEVDLSGQVNSDSFGVEFYSGIGGQVDFMRGAARSRGGRPIIALPSTAKDKALSRIVPTLRPGAGVVTSRGDVHYVVTEHGVADLYAKGVHERTAALIEIAHPKFRDELEAKAHELRLLPRGAAG